MQENMNDNTQEIVNENMQENNDEIKLEPHVADTVLITLYSGCAVLGLVTEIREGFISGDEISKCYRIAISDNNVIDVWAGEIKAITIYVSPLRTEYFRQMEEEYGVEFYDKDGKLKDRSVIINDFLVKGAWDKLDDEKKTLIDNLKMNVEAEVDLIDALNMSRNRNNELHKQFMELLEKRTKSVHSVLDFENDWNEKIDKMPELYQYAFNFMRKIMGIDRLLKEI